MAKHNPSHIYFSAGNSKRGQALITEINGTRPNVNLTFIELDLSSLASIKAAIPQFRHDRLDILMCNAGLMQAPGLSKDGYEIQFATNHLGHAMLIKGVLPTLLKTAEQPGSDVRIVSLTSEGWRMHPKGGIQFEGLNTVQDWAVVGRWIRYGQSKLANIVYGRALAGRYPSITCVSVHPGVVATDFVGNLGPFDKALVYVTNVGKMLSEEEGAHSQLYVAAAARKEDLVNGGFYMPVGVLSDSKLDETAKSEELRKELWDWTEKALEGF